jgi:hypothetical protein
VVDGTEVCSVWEHEVGNAGKSRVSDVWDGGVPKGQLRAAVDVEVGKENGVDELGVGHGTGRRMKRRSSSER